MVRSWEGICVLFGVSVVVVIFVEGNVFCIKGNDNSKEEVKVKIKKYLFI